MVKREAGTCKTCFYWGCPESEMLVAAQGGFVRGRPCGNANSAAQKADSLMTCKTGWTEAHAGCLRWSADGVGQFDALRMPEAMPRGDSLEAAAPEAAAASQGGGTLEDLPLGDLGGAYVALKVDLDRRKREYEASVEQDEADMKAIGGAILARLVREGADSFKVKGAGTLFRTEAVSVKIVDRDAFFAFVTANAEWEAIQGSCNKTWLAEQTADVPGVEKSSILKLNYRSAK